MFFCQSVIPILHFQKLFDIIKEKVKKIDDSNANKFTNLNTSLKDLENYVAEFDVKFKAESESQQADHEDTSQIIENNQRIVNASFDEIALKIQKATTNWDSKLLQKNNVMDSKLETR